jgi:hypothetical protein
MEGEQKFAEFITKSTKPTKNVYLVIKKQTPPELQSFSFSKNHKSVKIEIGYFH